jgi:hypothetical protein
LESAPTTNKRWRDRVSFTHQHGPVAHMTLEHSSPAQAFVANVSRAGLAVDIWSKDLVNELRTAKQLELVIAFNGYFQLRTQVTVLACKFIRKPSCHTHVRCLFNQLSKLERSQLDTFIDACLAYSEVA